MARRRKHPRTAVEDNLEMLIVSEEQANHDSMVLEVSYGGLRFATDKEFAVEENIVFNIPSLDPNEILDGKIVWKIREDHTFIYGLEISRAEDLGLGHRENK